MVQRDVGTITAMLNCSVPKVVAKVSSILHVMLLSIACFHASVNEVHMGIVINVI